MRRRYLVSYDVADDKRRTAIFKTLMANGDHVQFSVFLCELNRRELAELNGRLRLDVNHRQDQVIILDLGDCRQELAATLKCIGRGYEPPSRVRVV